MCPVDDRWGQRRGFVSAASQAVAGGVQTIVYHGVPATARKNRLHGLANYVGLHTGRSERIAQGGAEQTPFRRALGRPGWNVEQPSAAETQLDGCSVEVDLLVGAGQSHQVYLMA